MINKYRQKFILITMLSLLAVLVIIIGSINIFNATKAKNDLDKNLLMISNSDSFSPDMKPTDEQNGSPMGIDEPIDTEPNGMAERPNDNFGPKNNRIQNRYFIIKLNDSGEVENVEMNQMMNIDDETAKEYGLAVNKKNKNSGYYSGYRYLKTNDNRIIFLEANREMEMVKSFLLVSIIISLIGYALVFVLIFVLSKIIVKPFVKNQERQKRFITDASHELKTPLTIISADVEVIELESGQSEWSDSIKKQVERLRKLTNQMTLLSKMDEGIQDFKFSNFNLSNTLTESVDDFNNLFQLNGKKINLVIENDIEFHGNQELINEMFFILLDNANKYSIGDIDISLNKNNKQIQIVFTNPANVPDGNLDYLMNRFTRLDDDRNSKTGGSGIGLSIVKEIIELHKGSIKITGENNTIKFNIFLSL